MHEAATTAAATSAAATSSAADVAAVRAHTVGTVGADAPCIAAAADARRAGERCMLRVTGRHVEAPVGLAWPRPGALQALLRALPRGGRAWHSRRSRCHRVEAGGCRLRSRLLHRGLGRKRRRRGLACWLRRQGSRCRRRLKRRMVGRRLRSSSRCSRRQGPPWLRGGCQWRRRLPGGDARRNRAVGKRRRWQLVVRLRRLRGLRPRRRR